MCASRGSGSAYQYHTAHCMFEISRFLMVPVVAVLDSSLDLKRNKNGLREQKQRAIK